MYEIYNEFLKSFDKGSLLNEFNQGPVDISRVSEDGQTFLHLAAMVGSADIIDRLIKTNAFDINQQDQYGLTPMHYAILGNNLEAVEYLVNIPGFDRNIKDGYNNTPLLMAAYNKRLDVIKTLLTNQSNDVTREDLKNTWHELYFLAARNNDVALVEYLLDECRVDPYVTDENKNTALHHAAADSWKFKRDEIMDVIKLLVEKYKLDQDMLNHENRRAIDLAQNETHTFLFNNRPKKSQVTLDLYDYNEYSDSEADAESKESINPESSLSADEANDESDSEESAGSLRKGDFKQTEERIKPLFSTQELSDDHRKAQPYGIKEPHVQPGDNNKQPGKRKYGNNGIEDIISGIGSLNIEIKKDVDSHSMDVDTSPVENSLPKDRTISSPSTLFSPKKRKEREEDESSQVKRVREDDESANRGGNKPGANKPT